MIKLIFQIYTLVILSSSLYGLYRNNQAGNNIIVDISNIILTGLTASNYQIINYLTVLGNIYSKCINITLNNKIYDNTNIVPINLSGLIFDTDIVTITSVFSDINVGISKPVTINISNTNYPYSYQYKIAQVYSFY